MISRRHFLEQAGALATGLLLGEDAFALPATNLSTPALVDPNTLAPYVDPLPLPERAVSQAMRPDPDAPSRSVPYYRIAMEEIHVKVHRDLPPTRLWGFNGVSPGPLIETRSNQGLLVEWNNHLPLKHFLPIDYTLHGSGRDVPEVRSVIHLHGGRTPPTSDGYPEEWYITGKSATCHYPCRQDATMLFYHDHSMGTNRLNVYAGLQGLFLIRDAAEDALHLPSGKYELPLIIYDRYLRQDGQLHYPVSPVPGKPWVPEVFGNLVMVNGKVMPYHEVEPRKYRLRILNGSNGRFYRLTFGENMQFHVIGSDQGLLRAPVPLARIELSPGERADLILDFSQCAGQNIELTSDSLRIMQFRVSKASASDANEIPKLLRRIDRIPASATVRTRRLTLDEHLNLADQSMDMMLNNTPWHAPITEKPILNTTEIWEIINLTEDTHPIHLHLVRFQLLDRRRIDSAAYLDDKSLVFMGDTVLPATHESGWKDTIQVPPGTMTRIVVPFHGYAGRYVWHCHVLEHEDNEMMRPYEIVPS
ncbi:spore coat protein A [Edaphobacter acidisoli]|uniref:Spore coat protein A n=1 Tax=Edaphobacter acidisoli TaxID=2040573 RepID=A0A916RIW1_9BACT|nr:multicopper oxidase [Edaphobacter acidisoli]GGA55530.1 spore coat protein A [Edaphobacter acidisoli]